MNKSDLSRPDPNKRPTITSTPVPQFDTPSLTSEETTASASHSHSDSAHDPDVAMLATQLPTAIGGHMFSGGCTGKNPAAIQMDLQSLKASPVLNPHFRMVQRYIDCLNWYIDVCVSSQGPAGIITWMYEVQHFTVAVQKRAYQRMPLTMEERSAIIQFTTYWRQQGHNPYLMGRPEVQVVLLALAEVAQM